ncbi:sulfotransferase [Neobacillus niacini]|uniref:sulfotransferase family protein n=1 Tax=Neobacillus niacini TaxID=86668 RepID=UPI0028669955|nr:sulfotransferase [Neobacillus niacini]MDR6999840.1 hypothetical protein [Neobacillus niacini]
MIKDLEKRFAGPIVIGGVGGSGTRVIAEIIKSLGYYTGPLNKSNDNVKFAKLFGNPDRFFNSHEENEQEIVKRLRTFEEEMTSFLCLNQSQYIGWGWKNPVSHIYIEYLVKYFKKIKYIHVIRNGLEMAYSRNKNQLVKWGNLFRIKSTSKVDPKASLHYWYAANERANRLGKELLGPRFLLINFNDLCSNPEKEIKKMIEFLELEPAKINLAPLVQLIQPPGTLERYKNQDLSIFSEDDFELIRKLGFEI